jgi:Domain of Unknown Function (DUF1080)
MSRRFLIPAMLLGFALTSLPADEPRKDWKDIFNGKDFSGWIMDGPKEYTDKKDGNKIKPIWTIQDGMIRCAGEKFCFLRYDHKVTDFVLRVEYRMVKGGNSGIGIRTREFDPAQSTATRPSYYSYEVQLLDDAGKPADKHCTASLYRYVAPTEIAVKPAPEWNEVEIECLGPKIRISFNGKEVLKFDQSTDPELKKKPLSGFVCLQSHSRQIEFRQVRLREIPAK